MRYVLLVLLITLGVSIGPYYVRAYQATMETVTIPYEVISINGNPATEQSILGELSGSPEMFEIVSDAEFMLTVEIRAVPAEHSITPNFGGIIIRQKELRGVQEIARLSAAAAPWSAVLDQVTGLTYQAGPFYSEIVPAGTYRIEVSTPENTGKYILVIGQTKINQGYFATLGDIVDTYHFYNVSTLRMFNSPYIHYPLGILVLVMLMAGTWYWQRQRKHHA